MFFYDSVGMGRASRIADSQWPIDFRIRRSSGLSLLAIGYRLFAKRSTPTDRLALSGSRCVRL
jgi:hypothetical protein